MSATEVRVPQFIDQPPQVLFWSADEFGFITLFFILALICGGWIMWSLVILGPWGYITLKRRYNRGFLKHLFYMSGVRDVKHYPSVFIIDFSE